MATIEKRGANSWRVGVRVKNQDTGQWEWRREPVKFPSWMTEDQQREEAQRIAAIMEGPSGSPLQAAVHQLEAADGLQSPSLQADYTLDQFARLWLDNYVAVDCKPTYYKTVANLYRNHIGPQLGELPLQLLTPLGLAKYLAALKTTPKALQATDPRTHKHKPTQAQIDAYDAKLIRWQTNPEYLSSRTIHHIYITLDSILDKAVQWDCLAVNPLIKVDAPKKHKKKMRTLDDAQAVELLRRLASQPISFRCGVLLALTCSLRLGEAGALMEQDILWDQCAINITRARVYTPQTGTIEDTPKSDSSQRVIDLPPAMMVLLEHTVQYHRQLAAAIGDAWEGDGHIICSDVGRPLHHDTLSKQWRRFADRQGFLGIKFHELRHTHATMLFANNLDAMAVAARMGHADPATTLREYGHALACRNREAANTMQAIFDRAEDAAYTPEVEQAYTQAQLAKYRAAKLTAAPLIQYTGKR